MNNKPEWLLRKQTIMLRYANAALNAAGEQSDNGVFISKRAYLAWMRAKDDYQSAEATWMRDPSLVEAP